MPSLIELRDVYPDDDAGNRHFLVTEVTRMSNARVCVAAIDLQREILVRPLQWSGHHWPDQFAHAWLFPGAIIRQVIRRNQAGARGFPHASNDLLMQNDIEAVTQLTARDFYETLLPEVEDCVASIFPPLREHAYVTEHAVCPSLGSVKVDDADVYVNAYGKIRARFVDSDGVPYDCSLTDFRVHQEGAHGVSRLNRAIAAAARHGENAILRVGLANAWDGGGQYDPRRCYLQVNGIVVPE